MWGQASTIAGGYDKGVSFDSLADRIARRVKTLILIGATADQIEQAVKAHSQSASQPERFRCADLDEAVQKAKHVAAPGDVVLLSPACASYDQFTNFAERGDRFRALVGSL